MSKQPKKRKLRCWEADGDFEFKVIKVKIQEVK